jgi:UDP-glucose 4-epimerase
MAKTFLVTGIAGFIGAALVGRLSELGRVTGLSRTPFAEPNVGFFKHDIVEPLPDRPELTGATVIHCAAEIRSTDRQTHWHSNVIGTRNLLTWCATHHVGRVVLFSTGGVYGYVDGRRMREDDPVRPDGPYAETKYAAEVEARRAADEIGLQLIIFRLYFPFSRNRPSGVFHLVDNAVRRGMPLRINRGGQPRITPAHVADVVDAVLRGVTDRIPSGCYNLCGDDDISFLDLVRSNERRLGIKANLVFTDQPCGDMMGCNAALQQTGWRPSARLNDLID